MKKLLCTFFFVICNTWAYPTPEGLFLNASNEEVEAETIVFTFKLTELEPEKEMVLVSPRDLEIDKEKISTLKQEPQYFRGIFQRLSEDSWEFLQAQYKLPSMKNDSLVHFYEGSRFIDFMSKKTKLNPAQDLFYSSLMMIFLNEKRPFVKFLSQTNKNFKLNEQLINMEKRELYENYGKYLQAIKDDETLKDELISPLRPDDPEEMERVEKLINQPFYQNFPGISLVRDQKDFFLKLSLENFTAKFKNSNYQMQNFVFEDLGRRVSASFYDYVLLNGKHEVPKNVIYDIGSRRFKLEFIGLKHTSYKSVQYRRIKSDLKSAVGRLNKEFSFALRPQFLL